MKFRWKKYIEPFTKRKAWIQRIIVTALAASIAWQIGNRLLPNGGLVAAIVATLTVRISLHKSIREGMGQLLGTAIGVATALVALHFFGLGFIPVFVTVILSLVASRTLHLGEVASINVPISALIVIGPGLAESTAVHRTVSTLIGTAIAIAFSYFAHPKTPAGRTIDRISELAHLSADLLGEMSEAVAIGYSQEVAGRFLAKSRLLVEEIPKVRVQALEARSYARWFPAANRDEAQVLYERGIAIEHSVVQVRTISRTLFDIARNQNLPANITEKIAYALSCASLAVNQESKSITGNEERVFNNSYTGDLRIALASLAEEILEGGRKIKTDQFARGISLVTNLERIADSLDLDTPAITEVQSPDEVTEAQILALSPIEQGRKLRHKLLSYLPKGLKRKR